MDAKFVLIGSSLLHGVLMAASDTGLPAVGPSIPGGTSIISSSAPSLDAEKLFAFASPAVVRITVRDEKKREFASGSGFIVQSSARADGRFAQTVVTNWHVIRSAVYAS